MASLFLINFIRRNSMMKGLFKNIGPGTLIAAAFIGPGTVTVCTIAGVKYQFTLIWAMVLSIIATIVLQEMAARLGIISGKGLAETVRQEIRNPIFRTLSIFLIIAAILIGNAAYEAGNISGGALGLSTMIPNSTVDISGISFNTIVPVIGLIAFPLLYFGNYKLLEKSLIILVLLMSVSFILAAIMTKPELSGILTGMFTPKIPEEGLLMVIALVGTTVVPYNLFLHAALVKEKWNGPDSLKNARKDTYISIILGGIISIAIIVAAAAVEKQNVNNAGDLALALQPVFGSYATITLGIGLFAAGVTSAITAPLAAAYVARECFGWEKNLKSSKFRTVWIVILLLGLILSSTGIKPVEIIKFAQVANGLLLPVIGIFLIWVVNKRNVLGDFKNNNLQNLLGILIILICVLLGARSLYKVFFE